MDLEIVYNRAPDKTTRGLSYGNHVEIYAQNTQSIVETTKTIIHEIKHLKIGSTGYPTQKEEVLCFVEEAKHIKPELTKKDVEDIIKLVKKLYSDYPWR